MASKDQSIKRERSMNKIRNSLRKGAKGFVEIQNETKLSPSGLNETLKVMKDKYLVVKELVNEKEKYRLTRKGETWFEKYTYVTYDIDNIRNRNGVHYRDYSTIRPTALQYGFSWGIESDLVVDKDVDELKIFQPKDVIEIEELMYRKMKNNIKKYKPNVKNGKLVLGFGIDYNEVVKSIQQKSLAYINNMSNEELKIWEKYDHIIQNISTKDYEKLMKIRKKTYEKVKDLD